jgi:aminodeoxyfutalosine deaminase
MAYRKIQADRLFDGEKMFEGLDVPVLVGTASGQIEALLPAAEAGGDVQHYSGLLCPGFVNTHCHLELSHMAGVISPGTKMVDFLLQVMGKRGDSAQDPLDAARRADQRMYEDGIVAVGDISNNISTLPVKAGSLLQYQTFVEVAGFLPSGAEARLQQARQVHRGMSAVLGADRVSLAPHAPYSVSKPLFEALNQASQGGILSIHNQESAEENEFYRDGRGDFLRLYETLGLRLDFFSPYHTSSLAAYLPWLDAPSALLLVHNTASSAEDIGLAISLAASRGQSLYWCLCPGANQYIQDTLPPLSLLRRAGCTITLGTDSLASNRQLSILAEIRIIQDAFPEVTLEEVLGWATLNGARALRMDTAFGRFTPGSQPGIVLLTDLENGRVSAGTSVKRLA